RRVVRADVPLEAVLLLAGAALQAGAAGVDHAAHAHPVADLPVGDVRADGGDDACDLVADGEREVRLAPLVADGVDVAVADPGGIHTIRNECGEAHFTLTDSLRMVWMSLWQIPAAAMSMTTSPGRGSRRSMVVTRNG